MEHNEKKIMWTEKNVQKELEHFYRLLNCTGDFMFWRYNDRIELIETSAKEDDLQLQRILLEVIDKKTLLEQRKSSPMPVIIWSPLELLWLVAFVQNEEGEPEGDIYVVGPLSSAESVYSRRENFLKRLDISVEGKMQLDKLTKRLPVMSLLSLVPYVRMLHLCVTGKSIQRGDIQFLRTEEKGQRQTVMGASIENDRRNNYKHEQMVLSHIENGDLNWENDFKHMQEYGTGVRIKNTNMLERGKISVIVFISLCSRAAIRGGLDPDTAYTVGDGYIESVLACKTIEDARLLNHAMYKEFIQRVHKVRRRQNSYSREVQSCCDYIVNHMEKNLSVGLLAERLGCSEGYLIRKFKAEVGVGIADYIKRIRIDRAKELLEVSILSIDEIWQGLQFCSRSYFTSVFRQTTGTTPAKYRKEHQRV